MSVELSGDIPPKTKKSGVNNQEFKFFPKQYSFKDEQVVTIFHLLYKENKLKLPEARCPNEVRCTNDPNYCLFYRMVHHPTNKCFVLKDKIQALVAAGVLTLKSEQKKVTANMVTLAFSKTPKVIAPDGSFPIPTARLEINDPSAKSQEIKGLVSLTIKIGKIMWIHPDLAQDEQWDRRSPSRKANLAMLSLPCQMMAM